MKNIYLLLTKNVVEAQKYKLNWEEYLNRMKSTANISIFSHAITRNGEVRRPRIQRKK
jgi:hypothetical protein